MKPYNHNRTYEQLQKRVKQYDAKRVPESEATWAVCYGDHTRWEDNTRWDKPEFFASGITAKYAARYYSDHTDRTTTVYKRVTRLRGGYGEPVQIWNFVDSYRIC